MANFLFAQKLGLHILPVVNKIDVFSEGLKDLYEEIENTLEMKSFIGISAKTGKNLD